MKLSLSLVFGAAAASSIDAAGEELYTQFGCHSLHKNPTISAKDIEIFQEAFGTELVKLGQIYQDQGDYVDAGDLFVQRMYDCEKTGCIARFADAINPDFRATAAGIASYYVNTNSAFKNDNGFAISPPILAVRFQNDAIYYHGKIAYTIGQMYYTIEKYCKGAYYWEQQSQDFIMGLTRHKHSEMQKYEDAYQPEIEIVVHHTSIPPPSLCMGGGAPSGPAGPV